MTSSPLNVDDIKVDFPILKREINNHRLVYLDSASSSQKPVQVLDAMDAMYRNAYANVHRGVYTIAEEATAAYERGRAKVARFINAPSSSWSMPERSSW
jgi:cysteine desulfurase/selenocysteine lyase